MPKLISAVCDVLWTIFETESSYENNEVESTYLFKIHVFEDPVSKSPLIFCGGFPTYKSAI